MLFYTRLLIWKFAGIGVWSFIFNFSVSLIMKGVSYLFGIEFKTSFSVLSIFLSILVSFTYLFSLTSVPLSFSVASLHQSFWRLTWFFCNFLWLYISGLTMSNSNESAIVALLITFILGKTDNFVYNVSFSSNNRFMRLINIYKFPLIATIVVSLFSLVVYSFNSFFVSIYLFSISSFLLCITSIVAGERTSFYHSNGSRMAQGLRSNGYQRFLAFHDLFQISGGPSSRRSFLFRDPTGRVFSDIVNVCVSMFKGYIDLHLQLHNNGSNEIPAHQIHSAQWQKMQLSHEEVLHYRKKEDLNFIEKFFFQIYSNEYLCFDDINK